MKSLCLATLVALLSTYVAEADTAVIWASVADSVALQTVEGDEATCLAGKAYSISDEGEGDYLKITPNKWHSGIIRFGKIATGYNCKMGDGKRPNLGVYTALSFKAKGYNFDPAIGCEPRLDFYGGSYPRKTSNTIILKGSYVDQGVLVDYEYRQVVIPVADLVTAEFPLDQIQKLTFRNCPGLSGQRYDIQALEMTDTLPDIAPEAGGGSTSAPTRNPTASPTSIPTKTSTSSPTNLPTLAPTRKPTDTPTVGPRPDLHVYESVQDGYSAESSDQSCLYFADRDITSQVNDIEDYFLVTPDAWRSGGLSFGCLAKTDGVCTHTCFQNGIRPDFSPYAALALEL